MDRIHIKDSRFLDADERERIFHGMNMVFKGDISNESGVKEYIPEWDDNTFKWLVENGFNLIRLGIIWDAVEPEPGKYNEEYLAWVDEIIIKCKKYEIYVFLDMHQDLFSEKYSDGAPAWATLDDGLEHYTGDLWSDSYLFSDAVKCSFDRFWANDRLPEGDGIQDHYAKMWGMLASRYSVHENIIGFDVMNEPFPGSSGVEVFITLLSAFAHLTGRDMSPEELMGLFANEEEKLKLLMEIDDYELYSSMAAAAVAAAEGFENITLDSFYKKVIEQISAETDKAAFFLENSYFSNMGIQSQVKKADDDYPQVYAPHGYDLVVDSPAVGIASNARVDVIFDNHRKVQNRLGTPVIVGEWGAHGRYSEGLEHIEHILGKFDSFKWGHTYWTYFKGIEKAPVMSVLRRPHPIAAAGEIHRYRYDYENKIFSMEWTGDTSGTETEIYLPEEPAAIESVNEYHTEVIHKEGDSVILIVQGNNLVNNEITIKF